MAKRDQSVTRVHSAHSARADALRVRLNAISTEISRLYALCPDRLVDALAPRGLLIRACALGMPHTQAEDAVDDDQHHHHPLTDAFLDAVERSNDLVRVSLTVPQGEHERLAPSMRAYAAAIGDRGADRGAWLALDLRPKDLAPHAYGIVSCPADERSELAERWCDLTGALRAAHAGARAVQTIRGWNAYADQADRTSIRRNLSRVLGYGLRDLPRGFTRDLDSDVVVSGRLAGPWSAFRAAELSTPPPTPLSRFPLIRQSVTSVAGQLATSSRLDVEAACTECGEPIGHKRTHQETCSPRCRQRRKRRLARGAQP